MVRRILFASAVVALGLALPVTLRAQDMGGSGGQDEGKKDDAPKPDAPKPDAPKPDAPKPDAPKPADAPKPEAKKSVSFDAPSSWESMSGKGGKGGAGKGNGPRRAGGGAWKVKAADGDSEGAMAFLVNPPKAKDFDGELTNWMRQFETADGKKLDKSAAKTDSIDTGAGKAKTAEIAGTFVGRGGGKKSKKGDDSGTDKAPDKKAGWKTLVAYLQGPDGVWIARLTGPEKTVEKNRDEWSKWVKSAKVVEGAAAPAGGGEDDKHEKGEKPGEKDD